MTLKEKLVSIADTDAERQLIDRLLNSPQHNRSRGSSRAEGATIRSRYCR